MRNLKNNFYLPNDYSLSLKLMLSAYPNLQNRILDFMNNLPNDINFRHDRLMYACNKGVWKYNFDKEDTLAICHRDINNGVTTSMMLCPLDKEFIESLPSSTSTKIGQLGFSVDDKKGFGDIDDPLSPNGYQTTYDYYLQKAPQGLSVAVFNHDLIIQPSSYPIDLFKVETLAEDDELCQ